MICERELKRAKDDAEYYRERYEESEQRAREAEQERENQRKEDRRRMMPSNRLYNGEVRDFLEAAELHASACSAEITTPMVGDDNHMRKTIESCNKTMRDSIARARRAAQIYQTEMREVRPRITALLKQEGLDEWADALDSGDYSTMAI